MRRMERPSVRLRGRFTTQCRGCRALPWAASTGIGIGLRAPALVEPDRSPIDQLRGKIPDLQRRVALGRTIRCAGSGGPSPEDAHVVADGASAAGDYNMLLKVGWIMTVPGLLLTMVGSTVLSATPLARGSAPRLPAFCWHWRSPGVVDLASHLPGQCGAAGDVRLRDPRASPGFRICGCGPPGHRGPSALMGLASSIPS